jgi:hypothetical protein
MPLSGASSTFGGPNSTAPKREDGDATEADGHEPQSGAAPAVRRGTEGVTRTEGESPRQLAEQLGWDSSQFGKLERGQTLGGPEIVEALDQH